MQAFIELIQRITQYGTTTVNQTDKHRELKKALADTYALYLNLESSFDQQVYDNVERLDYAKVYAQVKVNFPDFESYYQIADFLKNKQEPKVEVKDTLDDLTDLILDLSEVSWRLQNTSLNDALWYFNTLMNVHSEQHLLNLLNYLKALDS